MKKTIYDKIIEADQKRSQILCDYQKKLSEAEADLKVAEKSVHDKLLNGNEDSYADAKEIQLRAASKVEYFKLKLQNEKEKPLFDNYVEVIKGLKEEQQKLIAENSKSAVKVMHALNNDLLEFYEKFDKSNEALKLACENTGIAFNPTIALPIKTIFSCTESVRVNPELSKYW